MISVKNINENKLINKQQKHLLWFTVTLFFIGLVFNNTQILYSEVTTVIGQSYLGRDIIAHKFGTGTHKALFVGGLHCGNGYEVCTSSMAARVRAYFQSGNNESTQIPNDTTLIIITTANPDGYNSGSHDNSQVPSVDLNRNWPTSNWQSDTWASGGGWRVGCGGTAPLSAPETLVLWNYIVQEQPDMVAVWHATAKLVEANEAGVASTLGRLYVSTYNYSLYGAGYATYSSSYSYIEEWTSISYSITGQLMDSMEEQLGIPEIDIELRDYNCNTQEVNGNVEAVKAVLQALSQPRSNIVLSTNTLNFSAVINGNNPSDQTFTAVNSPDSGSTSALTWKINNYAGWLSLLSASGSLTVNTTTTITVSADITGLAIGVYTSSITVIASTNTANSLQTINVTLNVSSPTYTITTNISPSGGGTVDKTPNLSSYTAGTQVTMTVTANSGYTFSGWTGDASGSSSTVIITVDSNKTVNANFTQIVSSYTLNTSVSPSSAGTVTKIPDQTTYTAGTQVTMTATANSGYTFSGWAGDASGSSGTVTIIIDSNKTVVANFTQTVSSGTYSLYTNISPLSAGTVTKNPDQASYTAGTQVTMTAAANSGYTFSSWTGDASGSSSTVTITVDSNKTVTANFNQNASTYTLNTSVSPSSAGTVTKNPGQTYYSAGTQVALTATANSGYVFSNWSGDISSTTNPVTVTMNSNQAVIANFTVSVSTNTYYIKGYVRKSNETGIEGVTISLQSNVQNSISMVTGINGYYEFLGLSYGNYTITPAKTGYSFDPKYKEYILLNSNKTDQNFVSTTVPETVVIDTVKPAQLHFGSAVSGIRKKVAELKEKIEANTP